MEIKEKMKKCFAMQLEFWQKQFNSYPKVPYANEFDNDKLFMNSSVDAEGYIEWQPKEQISQIEDEIIEKQIGVKLHSQLIEFYSSYCFLEFVGKMNNGIIINLDNIPFGCDINKYIIQKCIDDNSSCAEFDKYHLFELGSAIVDGNDGYLICFDNNSGKVLLMYFAEQIVLDLNMSLCDLFEAFVEVY